VKKSGTPSNADIAAEAGHFRSQAIQQELETGQQPHLVIDPVTKQLPGGVQVARPAFAEDNKDAAA
jgi:hypothetical protein